MKKKLALIPAIALLLSGCSLSDVKDWVRSNVVDPIKGLINPEQGEQKKDDEKKDDQKDDQKEDDKKDDETPELPAEYSLMKNWAANPSEEVYAVVERDDETRISYEDAVGEKSGGWEYVARSFAFDAQYIARFNEYKKISFTGKLHVTSGSNVVMIKVEGDAVNTYEAKFNFAEEPGTYELGLSFISDWTKVRSLLFFVDRETSESGSGMMTFTKFCLSKEEVNPDYNIAKNMPEVPQDWNIYSGQDEFNVNYRWGYDTTGDITTEEEEGAIAKFSWNGKSSEWAYVSALAKGDDTHPLAASGMKRIAFTVVGTADAEVLFKFQTKSNSKAEEVRAVMTGDEQVVEVDATKVLAAENETGEYLLAIFPAPGAAGESLAGQLVLKEAKMDKNEVHVDVVENKFDWAQAYIDNVERKDACFSIEKAGHVQTLTVNKTAPGWESIAYKMGKMESWFNEADYSLLSARITSDKATHVLLKAYNSIERWVELEANVPYVVHEELDLSAADFTQSFILFASTNEGDALDAVIRIEHLKLVKPAAINQVGEDAELLIDHVNASGEFACVPGTNSFTVNYTKTEPGWANMETIVAFDISHLDSIKGEVVSTVDTHVIIKPADLGTNEIGLDLKAGVAQKFDKRLVANGAWTSKLLMFICYEGSDALTGSVTFNEMKLYANSEVTNVGDFGSVRISKFYRADACYSPVTNPNTGAINVAFEKSEPGWESMAARITMGDTWYAVADYTKVYAILEADCNVSVLLKAYNAVERWVSLEANVEQKVEFSVDTAQANGADFIVFICAGDNAGALQGNVQIKSLALLRRGGNAAASDGKVYINDMVQGSNHITVARTANEKGMVVDYDLPETGYDACEFFISAYDVSRYNHIEVTLTSTANTHVLFKAFDQGANEHSVELTANTPEVVSFDVTPTALGQWTCKQVMFFATNGGDALQAQVTFADFAYSIK